MKIKTLLVIGAGTLLVAMTGCKSPERFTNLGNSSVADAMAKKSQDLSTTPFNASGDKLESVASGELSSELANEDGLADRDLDRSEFAAQTVYFEYDQANVKANEATKINEVIAALKAKGAGYDLLIEGHCDERGTEEYNRALGERRALAIRELMMQSGVSGTRVFTRTFGKDKPVVASHDETSWSKNRRGEFVLVLPKKLITTQLTK